MANTYTQINIQSVFAVKGRENILKDHFRDDLFRYISGILRQIGAYPLAVNGWKDHIHIFFELPPTLFLSDIIKKVKASSSKWINENRLVAGHFQWQEGYSAFSYSRNQRHAVIKYIMGQEEHHRVKTFKEEYMNMMKEFEIEYDMKYLFEFFEDLK
ncbi:MAG TPA: IS200/IS605 family transposase [Tenuifilaceae bacterium]|nr:IS200/IS605 family transposase [Tenuifilaceae bacterium]